MTIRLDDSRIDETARSDLDGEAERHRKALADLSIRDTDAIVAEANLHFDRVKDIMRTFLRRNPPDVL